MTLIQRGAYSDKIVASDGNSEHIGYGERAGPDKDTPIEKITTRRI